MPRLVPMSPRTAIMAAVLGAVAPPVHADWELQEEHWYVVEIAGVRAGSMVSTVETDADRVRTSSKISLTMGRGPTCTTIEISGSFEETADGRPLVIRNRQVMGVQPVESEWRFLEDRVVHTSRQGDRELVRDTEGPDGEWLTPMAAHRNWIERVAAGDKKFSYFVVDGQTGLEPIEITHTYVEDGTYVLDGREIPVTVWETSTSLLEISGIEHYTVDGDKVYEEMVLTGLGKMVTRLASKAEALRPILAAPEILITTFVEPSRPIDRVQSATTATLRLRVTEGSMPGLPSAAAQRVTPDDDPTSVTLAIDVNDNLPAQAADLSDSSYMESSAMINAGDPLIAKLAARAVRRTGDDEQARADALRTAVRDLLSDKGLDTAFATASETARTRTGDCSEHAVLLCAMLRADGIPARVAIGLVYADSFLGHEAIFVWHMWTQALIDGRWVDLDATLRGRYHAAHVLTAVSSLEEGGIDAALATTLMLLGNLQIDVIDVGYDR